MKIDWQGVFPAVTTQFNADLSINVADTQRVVDALIKDGVYQTALARPIVRAGRKGDYFEIRPDAMFEMERPD